MSAWSDTVTETLARAEYERRSNRSDWDTFRFEQPSLAQEYRKRARHLAEVLEADLGITTETRYVGDGNYPNSVRVDRYVSKSWHPVERES